MESRIKNLITWFRSQGFTKIKLPGGSERNNTFAAFCSIVKYNPYTFRWQILLIPYRSRTPEEEKKRKKEAVYPEVPEATVEREIGEETGVLLLKSLKLLTRDIKDKRPGHMGQFHSQHLFFSKDFDQSNRRRKPSPSQPNIEIPFWADLDDDLEREIAIEHLWMIQQTRRYVNQLPIPRKNKYHQVKKYEPAEA